MNKTTPYLGSLQGFYANGDKYFYSDAQINYQIPVRMKGFQAVILPNYHDSHVETGSAGSQKLHDHES